MKKSLLPILVFAKIDIRRLFRDKVAIFFVFAFPLLLLVIFGNIFGGDNTVSFRVAVFNQSQTQFAKDFANQLTKNEVFDIDQTVNSLDDARQKMTRGQLDAAIVLPKNFGQVRDELPRGQAEIVYDQSNQQAAGALGSIMQSILAGVNTKLVPTEQPFTVKTVSTASEGLSQFDYTFSGLLGFTILSLGIFGPTSVFPRLKQRGVLRRYHTTTLRVWQYFTANVISNSFAAVLALASMLAIAIFAFDLSLRGNVINLAIVMILGTILMFGIGLALGGWAKNENQAAPLAQVVALPMMFLSGVFFPTFLMPEFLQNITQFIPLTPVIDSIRLVITEGASLFDLGPQLLVMTGWTVIVYFIAFKVFRWE